VYLGTADGVTTSDLLAAIEAGVADDEVRSLLRRVPVQSGDTLLVEAGTVHAIDGGLAIFEVQQNSDTTYRLYDWGRGREVHVEEARAACVDHPPARVIRNEPREDEWAPLIRGHAFALWRARPDREAEFNPMNNFTLLTLLAGQGELISAERSVSIAAGDTALVIGEATLVGDDMDILAVEPPP
jgi:mannose-6-phosphate isomerase